MPAKLILSGRKSSKFSRENIISNFPNKEFWDEVSKLGGFPDEAKQHPELVEYITPILKADFSSVESSFFIFDHKEFFET